jgi:hypothetical protein
MIWNREKNASEENVIRAMRVARDKHSQCVLCTIANLGTFMPVFSDGRPWKCWCLAIGIPHTAWFGTGTGVFGTVYKPQLIIMFYNALAASRCCYLLLYRTVTRRSILLRFGKHQLSLAESSQVRGKCDSVHRRSRCEGAHTYRPCLCTEQRDQQFVRRNTV